MESQREDRARRLAMVIASTSVMVAGVYVVGCTKSEFANAPEIMLEAATSSGESPWMDSIATAEAPSAVPSSALVLTGEADTTQPLSGAEIGLYGGTPNSPVCDREKMATFLGENPDKADAFRQVAHAQDLGDFFGGLSPVVLTADTRVTNHGFDNGVTTFQSVLQKGTTVLVNDTGEPVVRCACGNPLAPPAALAAPVSQLRFQGDRWEDWNIKRLAAVRPTANPIKTFVLADVVAQQNLPADAPPPPPLAIDVGEPVPFVATPEVFEQAQQTARAEQAIAQENVESNSDSDVDTDTSDSTDSDDSSDTKSTPETETVTDSPVTDSPVTEGPVTEGPVTEGPVTEGPVTEGPVTEGEEVPVPEGESTAVDPALVPESEGDTPREEITEPVVGTDPTELPVELPPITDYIPQLPPITDYIPEIPTFIPTPVLPAP